MIIQVEAKDVSGKLYLYKTIASGKADDGRKIDIASATIDGSLYYRIGDQAYLVSSQEILTAILDQEVVEPKKRKVKTKRLSRVADDTPDISEPKEERE